MTISFTFLLKLPLFPQLAEFVWGNAGGDGNHDDGNHLSAEHCLSNILDTACIVRLAVKILGIGMITGAFLNKAPIIANILTKKSVAGLAKSSIYGEVIVLTNAFLYGFLEGLPFTAYGENFALLLQTIVIVIFIWNFSKTRMTEIVTISVLWMAYINGLAAFLPSEHNSILMRSMFPIMLYSKGSQILTIFQEKHTGNQSIVTLSMNCLGTSVRVLTTIAEVGWDFDLLLSHSVGAVLNFTLLFQYLAFKENTRIFWEGQAKKKE